MKLNLWIAGAGLVASLGAVALALSERSAPPPAIRAREQRPALALLTSLPLVFGERFALDGGGSATLTRLEQRYKVVPIGVADAASLSGQQMLLMAHARAQPADALVDLDRWVRGGGRLVLLADPKLDWESERPLGDKLRPPPAFADTGLLAHWGVELSADGPGELPVETASPGRLASRGCELANGGFIARCTIGKGRATIIADADFLNGEPTNLDLLIDELARLERR